MVIIGSKDYTFRVLILNRLYKDYKLRVLVFTKIVKGIKSLENDIVYSKPL